MFGGASELVLQYHSITIHIENAGGNDILSLLSLRPCVVHKSVRRNPREPYDATLTSLTT